MLAELQVRQAAGIERVVARLQQCLLEGGALPDATSLARIAHLSPFHFQRQYRALTGETLGRTVLRLRLARALQLLGEEGANVTDVALAVGYDSAQALARTLRRELDSSASELRTRTALREEALSQLVAPRAPTPATAPLQVSVRRLQPLELVVLRQQGPFDALDAGYGALFEWASGQGIADMLDALVGLPVRDADDHRDAAPDAFLFDCAMGFSVPLPSPPLPQPLRRVMLEGGEHACLHMVGDYAHLEEGCDHLLAHWLPGSGYVLRDAPIVHLFLDDPEQVPAAELRADVCVPVAPDVPG